MMVLKKQRSIPEKIFNEIIIKKTDSRFDQGFDEKYRADKSYFEILFKCQACF